MFEDQFKKKGGGADCFHKAKKKLFWRLEKYVGNVIDK